MEQKALYLWTGSAAECETGVSLEVENNFQTRSGGASDGGNDETEKTEP